MRLTARDLCPKEHMEKVLSQRWLKKQVHNVVGMQVLCLHQGAQEGALLAPHGGGSPR